MRIFTPVPCRWARGCLCTVPPLIMAKSLLARIEALESEIRNDTWVVKESDSVFVYSAGTCYEGEDAARLYESVKIYLDVIED